MRQARVESASGWYHVMSRGQGRMAVFEDDRDRKRFMLYLGEAQERHDVLAPVWTLMSNHVHLLVGGSKEGLGSAMHLLLGSYARWYNTRYEHTGHVFQSRFVSRPVESTEYLLSVVSYIHRNPLVAGYPGGFHYPWSSYETVRSQVAAGVGVPAQWYDSLAEFDALHGGDFGFYGLELGRVEQGNWGDAEALQLFQRLYGPHAREETVEVPLAERNRRLRELKVLGLTNKQIERLTGLGRGIIQRS